MIPMCGLVVSCSERSLRRAKRDKRSKIRKAVLARVTHKPADTNPSTASGITATTVDGATTAVSSGSSHRVMPSTHGPSSDMDDNPTSQHHGSSSVDSSPRPTYRAGTPMPSGSVPSGRRAGTPMPTLADRAMAETPGTEGGDPDCEATNVRCPTPAGPLTSMPASPRVTCRQVRGNGGAGTVWLHSYLKAHVGCHLLTDDDDDDVMMMM